MKPYYEDDAVTIYHGDSTEIVPQLGAGVAEMVLADPPYFRVVDAEWDDQWGANPAAFLSWLGGVLAMLVESMKDRGTMAVFCSHDMAGGVEMEVRKVAAFLNHIVWRKPGPGRLGRMDKSTMRRFFPTSERIILAEKARNPDGDAFRFRDHVNHAVTAEVHAALIARLVAVRDSVGLSNKEVDVTLGKNGMAGHYFGSSQWSLPTEAAWAVIAGMIEARGGTPPTWADLRQEFDSRRREFDSRRRELELLSDVWTFDTVPPRLRTGGHPTQKPEPLIRHMILTMSRPRDVILDPFMGSGTTLRVAKDEGRRAIGIEKDERYCEAAATRMAQEVLAA